MTRHGWNAEHRDALLSRVTLLTAGTAVAGAVGAVALGAGMAAASPVASQKAPAPKTTRPSTKPVATTPSHGTAPQSSATAAAGGGSGQSEKALAPADITVAVLNGTEIAGAAHAAAGDLRGYGFRISETGNYQGRVGQSIIGYPAGMKAAAQLLAAKTGVSALQQADTGGQLVLVIGPDWQGSQPVVQAPPPDQGSGGNSGGGGNPPTSSGGS
jgi:hypothetical protein